MDMNGARISPSLRWRFADCQRKLYPARRVPPRPPVPTPHDAAVPDRMSSQFKKAHKLHDYAQRAGTGYPRGVAGQGRALRGDEESQALYRELCEAIPDAAHRAALMG